MMATPTRVALKVKALRSQNFNTTREPVVGGEDAIAASDRDRAYKNIDGSALDSMIPAKIKESRRLNVIFGNDFFVEERAQQVAGLGEFGFIANAREQLLPDRAYDRHAIIANSFSQISHHLLLLRGEP